MAQFAININTSGTLGEARSKTARPALKQGLSIINTITGGKAPGDGSNPYTEVDIESATDQQLLAGLGILASNYIRDLATGWLKNNAAETARLTEDGSDATVPGSLG